MWHHWSIPHTLLTWLQSIFTCSLEWNEHERDGVFLILLTSLGMRRKSWKGFHRMASRNVSNTFTVAVKSVQLHKGCVSKENIWNDCTVCCLSEINLFREYFEATTYLWACSDDCSTLLLSSGSNFLTFSVVSNFIGCLVWRLVSKCF
jgi:hypothetical protein